MIVFVCSAYRSPTPAGRDENVRRALAVCRALSLEGHVPVAPHAFNTRFLDDDVPEEREIGLRQSAAMVALADEVRVYGEPTEGMRREIAEAERLGIPVVAGAADAGARSCARTEQPTA